ncbi:hypothetical protein [Microcoleus sp. B4-D4]|uniref:hypothetical protein n=1 Tax=Microcoleus sp. B4-D4 TaxID=2818667 RepID=UPI002FD1AA3B
MALPIIHSGKPEIQILWLITIIKTDLCRIQVLGMRADGRPHYELWVDGRPHYEPYLLLSIDLT